MHNSLGPHAVVGLLEHTSLIAAPRPCTCLLFWENICPRKPESSLPHFVQFCAQTASQGGFLWPSHSLMASAFTLIDLATASLLLSNRKCSIYCEVYVQAGSRLSAQYCNVLSTRNRFEPAAWLIVIDFKSQSN